MQLTLNKTPESNPYCIPAALALITGESVDQIVEKLRVYLGDQPISGIYYPLAIRILKELGYEVEEFYPIPKSIDPDQIFFATSRGHAFVLHDGKLWDNHNPSGAQVRISRQAILQLWRVWKNV